MGMLQNKMIEKLKIAGYSNKTVKNYTFYVKSLATYYGKSPLQITNEEISRFLLFVREEKKYSDNTMNICYNAIKFFYTKVVDMPEQMKNIPICKRAKLKPVVLDISEVEKIINLSYNLKYRTIFALIYSAGLRVGEVVNLTINDIDLRRNLIFIKSAKGNKDRYVILSKKVIKLYLEYIQKYKPVHWIFYAGRGNKKNHFSIRSIQRTFQDHLFKAGIRKNASVHTLRHSFATHLMESGTNIYHIQTLMGHNSPRTTAVYLHVQKSETLQVKSPLDCFDIDVESEEPYGNFTI